MNRGVTQGFGATLLTALELRGGVPEHLRTVVAVPTLLTTVAAIEEQIERLEVHHLASPEGDLHSRCCPIGSTPRPSMSMATRNCWTRRWRASHGLSRTSRPFPRNSLI